MVLRRLTAFVWSLNVITLALSATSSDVSGLSTKQNSLDSSSLEVDITTKTDGVLAEKILQSSTDACGSNADCQNGGVCWIDSDEGNYCHCKNGISGDFCEIVDECVENPPKCGNASDVECVYDLEEETTNCTCNNASKGFDSYLKKCRVPCTSAEDCPWYSSCIENDDNDLMFCHCPWGIGGDRCIEKVDECKERGLDCGNNPNVTCQKGPKGEAICYCEVGGWSVAFDYEAKECRACDCDSVLGCRFFPGGLKTCYCYGKEYQKDGKCIDCACGYDSKGCKLENGTKVCDCWKPSMDNGGLCEKCDCGRNSDGCTFENGQKLCSCKQDTIQVNGTCRKNCTLLDVECQHGGKCVDSACQCLPGTHGDVCEVIEGCETVWEQREQCDYWESTYCDFNTTSLKMYCRCKNEDYLYDPYDKKCKDCDCGPDGKCSFVRGERTCSCKEGYGEKPSRWGSDSLCIPCDCGQRSKGCTFIDYETKQCKCDDGYSQRYGECSKCDCGPYGTCSFDWGRKVCDCSYKFQEKNGICYECDCGYYGECEFNDEGEKICNCREGYEDKDGECTYCTCYLNDRLISCNFIDGIQNCLCPKGYKEIFDSCIDINECLNQSACPMNTVCMNTEGNYTCNCKNGYRPWSKEYDTKRYGCKDINECVENNACPYRDTTECVNTQGSYFCQCKKGYNNRFSKYPIEMEGCEKDQTGWKIGYILLIVVFSVAIIGLSIALIRKRLSS